MGLISEQTYAGPFYTHKEFMVHRYGHALYKIPLNFSKGCPNRSKDGKGGCTFCPENGNEAPQIAQLQNIQEQVAAAQDFARKRYGAQHFCAYIQAYTATFGPLVELKTQVLNLFDEFQFESLHIGTRPDCLPEKVINYLEELNHKIDLWVELGVQTIHDKTLTRVNRGHNWQRSEQAIRALHEKGVNVIAHVILGLPGESWQDMMCTARKLASLPLSGIKIHNLHILNQTELADEYIKEPFYLMGELEYIQCVAEFLRYIPAHIPVMRVSTDSSWDELIAPRWTLRKGQILSRLISTMSKQEVRQGDLALQESTDAKKASKGNAADVVGVPGGCTADRVKVISVSAADMQFVKAGDGSLSLYNNEYKSYLHGVCGGQTQAREVYLKRSDLGNIIKSRDVRILDIGFGMGYNSIETLNLVERAQASQVAIDAIEHDRNQLGQLCSLLSSESESVQEYFAVLEDLYLGRKVKSHYGVLDVHFFDARYALKHLLKNKKYDLIFLDGYNDIANAELYSLEFFVLLKTVMHPESQLISAQYSLRIVAAMTYAGFRVDSASDIKTGTRASLASVAINEDDLEIPYRDQNLCLSRKEIVRARDEEQLKGKEIARAKAEDQVKAQTKGI
ncbi:MAG: TIGR01212 family radical SAM protein [Planctomycetes bacterium]|nr:TIGR01212 family radical SAM protein [Planctomycetota bacterium]